jgi:hypothetical protein
VASAKASRVPAAARGLRLFMAWSPNDLLLLLL